MFKNYLKSSLNLKMILSIILIALSSFSFGQTTLINYGFEAADATWTYSLNSGVSNNRQNNNANGGAWSNRIIANSGNNQPYSGSTATPVINFVNGRYYRVTVWAKRAKCDGALKITKATTNTYAALNGATGGDVLFNGTGTSNVTSTAYTQYTFTFQASATENKYIGFVMSSGGCNGGPATNSMFIDDVTVEESTTPFYCTPSSTNSGVYINSVSSIGAFTNGSNTNTGYTGTGYTNYTAINLASQIPNGGINIDIVLGGTYGGNSGQFIRTWVDWNKDGDFLDAGELVYTTGSTATALNNTYGFTVPVGTAAGTYRLRIRTRAYLDSSTIDSCTSGYTTGETEDYTITVIPDCSNKILTVTDGTTCGAGNSVTLNATATAGAQIKWYDSVGTLLATVPQGNWSTGPLPAGITTFYATAVNGCETLYKTEVKATVNSTTSIAFTPLTPTTCGEDDVLTVTANAGSEIKELLTENFESGSFGNFSVTTPTNIYDSNGSGGINAGDTGHADSPWSVRTSAFTPTGTSVWSPAVSSGNVGNRFAFTTSDHNYQQLETILTSISMNPTGYTDLTLTYREYYSDFANDTGTVEVSVNGGAWSAVSTNNSDIGSPPIFSTKTIDLTSYIAGTTNLRIRFRYLSGWADGWAIDDIRVFGTFPYNATFTWSGGAVNAYTDLACTTPYVAQPVTTIYIKPQGIQYEQASWSFTATATLSNGCTASNTVNVTNKSKVWKGTTNNDWNTASNWLPAGIPTANDCVIIPTGTATQIMNTPNALAKNIKVKGTGNLELQSGRNLTVTDWINVESGATFNIRNNANLVQVTNSPSPANSGDIKMERTAFVDFRDYVYWSSPVAGFNSANISTYSNNANLYKWIPTTGATNGFGNWTSGVEIMVLGKGYIERGLNNAPLNSPVNFTSTFTGVPNNGTITTPISRGTYSGVNYATGVSTTPATDDDDNWNLLGNPYPSAISAADFLNANATDLDGFVKIWTHGIAPSATALDPFYNNYGYNYDPNDYITWNLSGPSTPGFSGYIGAGQGFITKMKHTSPSPNSNAVFNNSMRNATHTNSEFYRSSNEKNTIGTSEGHIWIDLVSSTASTRALIAYVNGATNEKDQMYDAQADLKSNFRLNSLLGFERLIIQGKQTPFDPNDQVNLVFSIPTNGTYNIAIGAADGLFTDQSQNIYLEDKQLNVIHDLRSAPYQFTAMQGENANRFVLRYTNQTLSNNTFDYSNSVTVYANENINIKSSLENIKEITVYDILGKTLLNKNKVGKNETVLNELKPTSGVIIVKVILDNGSEVTKKVIF